MVRAVGADFVSEWARHFVQDKFGSATSHWNKLQERIKRGVRNPCPLLLIGIQEVSDPSREIPMTNKPKRRPVTLVRSTYQPTKADMEEMALPVLPEEATLEDMARAVFQPVKIDWIGKPE